MRMSFVKDSTSADISTHLKIQYLPISQLKPDPRNPRTHPKKQLVQIGRSVERFGFITPVLVNAEYQIIAGHGRVEACKLIGRSEVPTICIEHLSPEQARAFMLADNKLAENAV